MADGHMALTTGKEGETCMVNEPGTELRRRDGITKEKDQRNEKAKKGYLKEATVTVETSNVSARAEDIIKAITEKIGKGKILAVRPKQNKEYEVTLENVDDVDLIENGLTIKEVSCGVKRLQNRDYVVSFMHLPAYIDDQDILNKLKGWGVNPISGFKRRVYPGTTIEDGTRFVKCHFPKDVPSLPYSTKLETAEGPQFFRVMHSHQIKTCRLCMSPEHIMKDCPDFKCHKCEERGHFARDCNAVRCPDCKKILNKCECWFNDDETHVSGQAHERDDIAEQDGNDTEDNDANGKDNSERMDLQDTQQDNTQRDTQTQSELQETAEDITDESTKGQRKQVQKEELKEQKQQKETGTSLDWTDTLDNEMDSNEDLNNGAEKMQEDNIDEDEDLNRDGEEITGEAVKLMRRRRQAKVKPNLEGIRKKRTKT